MIELKKYSKKQPMMPAFFLSGQKRKRQFLKQSTVAWRLRYYLTLAIMVCFTFFGVHTGGADELEPDFMARVERVIDGDSFSVKSRGKKLQVRLWGVDTPEWQQGFSQEAKSFSRQQIQGRQVKITQKGWDKYGRLVALVEVDGESLSELLLREGLAWVHIYYCHEPICEEWRQLERLARTARRGLWQEKEPVPPWKWKRGQRGNR
jgi:endonuclease YncB( thermonuclease family)